MDKLHDGQSRSGDFIDLNDAYQVKQWAEIFNITTEELKHRRTRGNLHDRRARGRQDASESC